MAGRRWGQVAAVETGVGSAEGDGSRTRVDKRNLNSRWKTRWKRQWFFVETPGLLSSQETRRLLATYP